jgi:hypothetical protein
MSAAEFADRIELFLCIFTALRLVVCRLASVTIEALVTASIRIAGLTSDFAPCYFISKLYSDHLTFGSN